MLINTSKKIKLILAGSKGVVMAKPEGHQKKTLVDFKVTEDTDSESPKIAVVFEENKQTTSLLLKKLKFTQLKTKQL